MSFELRETHFRRDSELQLELTRELVNTRKSNHPQCPLFKTVPTTALLSLARNVCTRMSAHSDLAGSNDDCCFHSNGSSVTWKHVLSGVKSSLTPVLSNNQLVLQQWTSGSWRITMVFGSPGISGPTPN